MSDTEEKIEEALSEELDETKVFGTPEDPSHQEIVNETPALIEGSLKEFRDLIAAQKDDKGPLEAEKRKDDSFCLRYLRVQKFKADKAAKRYASYWKKRRELFQDNEISFHHPEAKKTMDLGVMAIPEGQTDRWGRQIIVMRSARVDYNILNEKSLLYLFWVFTDFLLNKEEIQKHGVVAIQNMENVARANLNQKAVRHVLDSLQNCVPIRLGGVYVCHQPFFFTAVFKVLRLFMKEKLRRRFHLMGSDRSKLTQFIEPKNIPKDLDGESDFDIDAWYQARLSAQPVVEYA